MANIRIRFSEEEIRAFLNDPVGPLAALMAELGGRVAVFARAKVAKRVVATPGKHGVGGGFPPLETLDSIEEELHTPGERAPYSIISAAGAAIFLEKGTKRHVIKSQGEWSLSNLEAGYFGPKVDHPGALPRPFLTVALWALQGQV